MDETYASNVANLNERLREYKQGEVDKASSLNEAAQNKFNTQLAEYTDKWKAIQEGGQDEMATQMGLKGVYSGAKKVYNIYKKYKGKKVGADEDDSDHEEDEDDGTEGGAEGDPQGAKLDASNDPAPLTDEDRAALRDPLKESRALRQATQDRMNSRLKELGFDEDDTAAPSASGSASQAPADTGGGTDDANVSQARATAEGTDFGEPYEESAFGDLSGIPEEGTASSVMFKLNAQAATESGGNIGQGGSARGTTGASDAATSQNAATSEGQPASGSATEGGNSAPTSQSQSSYNPEGSQSRTLDQNAGTDDITGQTKQPSTKPASGEEGGDGDANPLDADLPETLAPAAEEGGGFLASLGVGEAAAAAIPVAGEALAFVGGLVAIGEGIYHLFHPPHKKLPTAPIAGTQVPQSVQAKYANALPSFDSSSDNMTSDAVF